jgi:predicted alpha-1,2-mannosidase
MGRDGGKSYVRHPPAQAREVIVRLLVRALTVAAVGLSSVAAVTPAAQAVSQGSTPTPPALLTGRQSVRLANVFAGTDTTLADRGTGGSAGNMSPAATAPFGMMSWGPRTVPDAISYGAGYTYSDKQIDGFDLDRFQGGGCSGFGDVPVIPTTTSVRKSPAAPESYGLSTALTLPFNHRHESASPGRYSVVLSPGSRTSIGVHLAAATRAGEGRFTFPSSGKVGTILLNAGGSEQADDASNVTIHPASHSVDITLTSGRFCEQPVTYQMHVVMHFTRAFASHGVWSRQAFDEGGNSASSKALVGLGYTEGAGIPPLPGDPSGTAQAGAVLRFNTKRHRSVGVRVGMSYVSLAGARAALRREVAHRSLESVARRTSARWAHLVGRVRVGGGAPADRRMLATTMYQSLLSPQIISDVSGRYPALDGKIHRAGHTTYSQMSLWDEYRSHAQFLSLVDPSAARGMAQSLLADERIGGFLPRWPVVGASPDIMVGDPAVPFLADLEAFGVHGFSRRAALAAAVHGAKSNGVNDENPGLLPAAGNPKTLGGGYYAERPGNPLFGKVHYVPVELDATTNTTGGIEVVASPDLVWGSASTSLEYATADFATSRLAAATCQRAVARRFEARAAWWHNDFDPANHYIQARTISGAFLAGGQTGDAHGFVEGDASQYTFMVPFDVGGLRHAIGGRRAFVHRLNLLFAHVNDTPNSAHAFLGNEPGLDTPYEYLWAGRPDRTESVVRRAFRAMYAPTPAGYPGNLDGGTLSSWWIFNALGLFPAIPGDDVMTLGSPLFAREVLRLPHGHVLRIAAPGASRAAGYVAGASLRGHPLDKAWVHYADLARGGSLRIRPSRQPTQWARGLAVAPPSFTASTPVRCSQP